MDSKSTIRKGSQQHQLPSTVAHGKADGKNVRQAHGEPRQGRTSAKQYIPQDQHFSHGGDLAYRHEVTGAARKGSAKNSKPAYRDLAQGDERQPLAPHDHVSRGGDLAYHAETTIHDRLICTIL